MIGAPSCMVILTWLLAFGQAFFGLCSAFCLFCPVLPKKNESGQKEVLPKAPFTSSFKNTTQTATMMKTRPTTTLTAAPEKRIQRWYRGGIYYHSCSIDWYDQYGHNYRSQQHILCYVTMSDFSPSRPPL